MKKHKSVVAILLAVMMIFTMMPMMAFAATAADGAVWADDFKSVTVKHDDGTSATYDKIKSTVQSDGMVKVEIDKAAYSTAPTDSPEAYYVDLTGAKLGYVDGSTAKAMPSVFTSYADFAKFASTTTAVTAAYAVKKADGTFYDYKAAEVSGVWKATVTGGEGIEESKDDQTATLSFKKSWTEGATEKGTAANPFVIGEPGSVTVTIKGTPETAANIKFYYDTVKAANGVKEDGKLHIPYDGASHTIVTNEVAGLTVSYQVYDSGKWTDTTAVSVKDVADSKTIRYTVKKADGTAVTGFTDLSLEVVVDGIESAPVFGFTTTGGSTGDYEAEYLYKGSEYDKAEHFDIAAPSGKANKQLAAAVAANKAELQKFFNDYFQIDAAAEKFSPDFVTLSISVKEGLFDDAKAKAALDKQYKALADNFGIDLTDEDALEDLKSTYANDNVVPTASIALNDKGFDYEIEFTQAPAGAKVFKANKKGKLAKNKTFKVKAVSGVGAEVSYKLVNANSNIKIDKKSGKITVKKGLKKGTYTFKVKAYVAGHDDRFDNWYEYQTVKVKIKK